MSLEKIIQYNVTKFISQSPSKRNKKMLQKRKYIISKLFASILIVVIYGAIFMASIESLFDSYKIIGLVLLSIVVAITIVFSKQISSKKKSIFNYLFIVHFLATLIFMSIEYYDVYFTNNFQVSDSIMHFFGWKNTLNDNFMMSRVFGFGSVIVPITVIICNILVFGYYNIKNSISK